MATGCNGNPEENFSNFHEKMFALENRRKRGGMGDGYSDAQTIYAK